jgi:serine/threonine protein kinase
VWSLGITVIEMAKGLPPLHEMTPLHAMVSIPNRPAPQLRSSSKHSAEMVDFVNVCLIKDPSQRSTVRELLVHPWLIKHVGAR